MTSCSYCGRACLGNHKMPHSEETAPVYCAACCPVFLEECLCVLWHVDPEAQLREIYPNEESLIRETLDELAVQRWFTERDKEKRDD